MADHDRIDKKRNVRPGEDAARILAKRLIEENRKVKIVIPSVEGTDWLDVFNSDNTTGVAA